MSVLKLGQIYNNELEYIKKFDNDGGIERIVDKKIDIAINEEERITKTEKNFGNLDGQAKINYYKTPQKLLVGDDDPESYGTLDSNFFDFELIYNNNFQKGENYYINFKSEIRIDRTYEIKVYLYNDIEHTQYLAKYRINQGISSNEEKTYAKKDFLTHELIFRPNENYSHIRFEVVRSIEDYLDNIYREVSFPITQEQDGENYNSNFNDSYHPYPNNDKVIESGEDKNVYNYKEENMITNFVQSNSLDYNSLLSATELRNQYPHGMVIEVKINRLLKLNNILPKTNNNKEIIVKRIGVQASPNLFMCINGEGIRVGNSGLYEPIVDYTIDFFSFIPREDKYFNIMLDYQYKEKDV